MKSTGDTVTTVKAAEVVTQATLDHVKNTEAVCDEWLAGYYDMFDGSVGEYKDNGVSWVFDEFLMTNWWESYIWDGSRPTARNAESGFRSIGCVHVSFPVHTPI